MAKTKQKWQGVFPAIVTPFDSQGEIDEDKFRRLIEYEIQSGVHGIVVCGGGGEYWSLTTEERSRLYRLAVKGAAGRIRVIAGTSSARMQETLELTATARTAGCDGAMVEPPSYYWRPSRREIIEYYREIDKLEFPLVVYNIPGLSGVNLTPDLISELAELSWVAAIKESSEKFAQVVECIKRTSDRLVVFAGFSVILGAASALMGADGYISTEPNFVPQMTLELFKLARAGQIQEAREVQFRMADLYQAIFHRPAAYQAVLKAAMNLLGLPGGYPRPPIAPLLTEEVKELRSTLERLGLTVV